MTTRAYDGHEVDLQNLDKVLFPDAGLTKGDLVDYYERVAEWMLPHLRGRPLSLERFPDGLAGEGFYQKQTPDYFPPWIATASVPVKGKGDSQSQVVCENQATLVYLANQACVTPHVWLSRRDRLDVPDRMVFDLDPPSEDFAPVRSAARVVRERLADLGLSASLMLTGSKGAHVVVPLRRESEFDRVRALARRIAGELSEERSDELTVEQRKSERGGRVFLDTARNAYGQTTVAPYAVRARPGAPVAVPIDWDELDSSGLVSSRYTIENLFRRLAQKDDPWRDIDESAQSLGAAERALDERRASAKE